MGSFSKVVEVNNIINLVVSKWIVKFEKELGM